MPKVPLLQAEQSYDFRSYFETPYETDEIVAEFGYTLAKTRLVLPQTSKSLDRLIELQQRIESALLLVNLSSEAARRETLVAPILLDVARYCDCQVRIEYGLTVNNWLKGNLDYLLRFNQSLLVVEAKNDDLTRGFTQLAMEMIALAQAEEPEVLYGAVTIGDAWRFGRLDRQQQQISQDIDLYRVPGDLTTLMQVLIGIIEQ